MARTLRDHQSYPNFGYDLNMTVVRSSVAIGASGAVDSTVAGYDVARGITVTRTGTGTYSLVFPACPRATVQVFVEKSAVPTVFDAVCTAKSPTAGTATFKTFNAAGTATDPASGDLIAVIIYGAPMGAQ